MSTVKRILITGAAGFVGSHLARALIDRGDRVVGIDNFDPFYDRSIKEQRLSDIATDRFTLHEADIRDANAVSKIMREASPHVVIHLAALAGVRPSIAEPLRYADVNVNGTTCVLEAARATGCRSVVFASSSSVYGDRPDGGAFRETDDVDSPVSPYAATKRAGELQCHAFHHLHQMSIACCRLFTVFGPSQRPDLAIARFMRLIAADQPIPVFGDGTTARDYTYVDDIVTGLLAVADRVRAESPSGFFRTWNLGGAAPVTLHTLIETIADVTGRVPQIDRLPLQPGDVTRTHADLSRVHTELGWTPSTGLREGLEAQWESANNRSGTSS